MAEKRRVTYRLPRYPMQERGGTVEHEGPDGLVVLNDETKLPERVRHRDVIKDGDKRPEVLKSVAHELVASATPETLRNIARQYADQYAPGHPAHLDPDQCDWHYDPAFPLYGLPGTREEWLRYNAQEGRDLGFAENPTPLIIVEGLDGKHYIWDGNHRTGEAHAAGWDSAPAIVGCMKPEVPADGLPPGSEGRSGLRKSATARPLVLAVRGHRLTSPVRMRMRTLLKSAPLVGQTPAAKPHQPADPAKPPRPGEWPLVAQPRYAAQDWVQYQRPDMPAPGVGRILHEGGDHGTLVAPEGGAGRHKVRWESIHGKVMVGVAPEERQQAAQALGGMGVPVDPLERFLLPDRAERPNPHLVARLATLVADGAPIDPAAAKAATATEARRLIEHFAGPVPREDEQRPQRPSMKPSARLSPWAEE